MALGFLLHSRPFRERSAIASFLTESEGRLDAVVRLPRSRQSAPMPFCQYALEWTGRSELKSLTVCELAGPGWRLHGTSLYCGLYLNELLYRLAKYRPAGNALFSGYQQAVEGLALGREPEPLLRQFELLLLQAMGFGLCLDRDINGQALVPEARYAYAVEAGLVPAVGASGFREQVVAAGADFLAMAHDDYSSPVVRAVAKQLLRAVLAHYLGGEPLRSRHFFLKPGQ